MTRISAALVSLFMLFGLISVATAHEVTMRAEERIKPYTGSVPDCGDPEVLRTIQARFRQNESGYWNSELAIDQIDRVGASAFRPWGADFIPRRFCHARAWLNNGKRHNLQYSIIEDGGVIGFTWGVQWCVVGLDRNMHYAPQCRAARP